MSSAPAKLADALGFASVGLGIPPLAVPDAFLAAIGVHPSPKTRAIARGVGAQELGAAAGILGLGRPRPTPVQWSRGGGDVLHLAMLARSLGAKRNDDDRLAAAIAAVVGIGALDVFTAIAFTRDRQLKTSMSRGPAGDLRSTITILASPEDIRARWSQVDGLPPADEARFTAAPGDRGTEVQVTVKAPPAGNLGRMVTGAMGKDPKSNAKDGLRRLKQIIETGEVVRSDGTPEGQETTRMLKQRPAQPLGSAS